MTDMYNMEDTENMEEMEETEDTEVDIGVYRWRLLRARDNEPQVLLCLSGAWRTRS